MTQTPQTLDEASLMPVHTRPSTSDGADAGRESTSGGQHTPRTPETILYVGHTAALGGGEIALLRLLRHLDRRQYRPLVVLGEDGPFRAKLRELDIETHVLPLSGDVAYTRKDGMGAGAWLHIGKIARASAYAARLARFMRRHRVDLVHANTLKADIYGGIAARLAGLPILWHVRDRIADDYLPGPTARIFRRLCRTLPTQIITNSHATMETLALPARTPTRLGGDEAETYRWRVIHDGVDDAQSGASADAENNGMADRASGSSAGPGAYDPPPDAARFPLPLQDPARALIGMVGRLSPWKGQHVFIEAAALVHARYPRCRFQIVGSALFGEAEYVRRLEEMANAPGLEGCVELLGFRDDVPALMRTFDVLVHASTLGEPFGQVVVEGMVMARPVVASRAGAIPEIVQEGVTGLMVTPGDAPALADALLSLLADPGQAARMGQAGRTRALEHFSMENTTRKVQAVYYAMLHKNTPHK